MAYELVEKPVYRVTCDICEATEDAEYTNPEGWAAFHFHQWGRAPSLDYTICDECRQLIGALILSRGKTDVRSH